MSVVSPYFPGTCAHDIHLLPGNECADTPPAGFSTSLQPLFIGAPSNHDVIFDAVTGKIEITSPLLAGPRLRSFIVRCSCTEADNIFIRHLRDMPTRPAGSRQEQKPDGLGKKPGRQGEMEHRREGRPVPGRKDCRAVAYTRLSRP